MNQLEVEVSSKALSTSEKYVLVLEYPATIASTFIPGFNNVVMFDNQQLTLANGNVAFKNKSIYDYWYTGEYKLHLVEARWFYSFWNYVWQDFAGNLPFVGLSLINNRNINSNAVCQTAFKIADNTQAQDKCDIHIVTKPIEPGTNIELQITGVAPSNDKGGGYGGYDIKVDNIQRKVYSTSEGENISIGAIELGLHRLSMVDRCGFLGTSCLMTEQLLQCPERYFEVGGYGENKGGEITDPQKIRVAASGKQSNPVTATGTYCQAGNFDSGISTAIGCIHTDPELLIKDLFKLATGIGGGIAFLLMVIGAFQMVISAGDAEAVKAGRERFESAIIGLVFVIFSIFILRFIGVDILGFGSLFGVK